MRMPAHQRHRGIAPQRGEQSTRAARRAAAIGCRPRATCAPRGRCAASSKSARSTARAAWPPSPGARRARAPAGSASSARTAAWARHRLPLKSRRGSAPTQGRPGRKAPSRESGHVVRMVRRRRPVLPVQCDRRARAPAAKLRLQRSRQVCRIRRGADGSGSGPRARRVPPDAARRQRQAVH